MESLFLITHIQLTRSPVHLIFKIDHNRSRIQQIFTTSTATISNHHDSSLSHCHSLLTDFPTLLPFFKPSSTEQPELFFLNIGRLGHTCLKPSVVLNCLQDEIEILLEFYMVLHVLDLVSLFSLSFSHSSLNIPHFSHTKRLAESQLYQPFSSPLLCFCTYCSSLLEYPLLTFLDELNIQNSTQLSIPKKITIDQQSVIEKAWPTYQKDQGTDPDYDSLAVQT